MRILTGPGPRDTLIKPQIKLWEPDPIAPVQWVEVYQGQLDTNPNGGGKRMFPDKDSPGGSKTDYVKVEVKIKYPGLAGESIPVKVWIETPNDPTGVFAGADIRRNLVLSSTSPVGELEAPSSMHRSFTVEFLAEDQPAGQTTSASAWAPAPNGERPLAGTLTMKAGLTAVL